MLLEYDLLGFQFANDRRRSIDSVGQAFDQLELLRLDFIEEV
jgi:hypothetical protein